jgi:hypothetical protein
VSQEVDPELVDQFCAHAGELLGALDELDGWDALIGGHETLSRELSGEDLDRALEASFPPRESLYDHLYGDENWHEQFSRMAAGAPYGERGEEQTWPT